MGAIVSGDLAQLQDSFIPQVGQAAKVLLAPPCFRHLDEQSGCNLQVGKVFCILYCAPAPPHRVPCSTITLLHPTSSQRMTTSETDRTALANWNVRRRQATTPLGLAVAPKSPPQTWVLLLAGWLPSFAYPQAAALCGLPPIRGESSQVRYLVSPICLPQPHSENGRNWPRNC